MPDKRASGAPDQAPSVYDERAQAIYRLREENERLRDALREFARRIERDLREPDKVLIEVTSMRAVADNVRDFPHAR